MPRLECGAEVVASFATIGELLTCQNTPLGTSEWHAISQADVQRFTEATRFDVDRAARLHNQARLRALAKAHPHRVEALCSHDPVELDRYQAD
jgi:hypothetical protein